MMLLAWWAACACHPPTDDGTSPHETGPSSSSTGETGTVTDPRVRPLDGVIWRDRPGQEGGKWLSLADVDGDGADEIFIGLPSGPYMTETQPPWSGAGRIDGFPPSGFVEALAGATWRATPPFDLVPGGAVVGDVTGDGGADLALAWSVADVERDVRVFSAVATGLVDEHAWTGRVIGSFGGVRYCGDLDGDGVDDLWAGEEIYAGPLIGDRSVEDASLRLALLQEPRHVKSLGVAGDLDGSGRPDLVVTATSDAEHIYGLVDPGWGDWTTADADLVWTLEPVEPGNYGGARQLRAADLDADGTLDLVALAWSPDGEFATYAASASGGELGAARTKVVGTGYSGSVATGDLDGDGVDDLAVESSPLGELTTDVWVLRGPLDAGVLTEDDVDVIWQVQSAFGDAASVWNLEIGDLGSRDVGELLVTVGWISEAGNAIVVLPGGGL